MRHRHIGQRKGESGQTIAIVAFTLVALMGMAALAIDVASLYVARSDAQRAADAAALAGASMFVNSGYTSRPSAFTASEICTSGAAGANAAANRAAEKVLQQQDNYVSGQAATLQSITCDFTQQQNPMVTVTVQRTSLRTFFSRIWSSATSDVRATAMAEAYNASAQSTPVSLTGVKPWLLANCDQNSRAGLSNPLCGGDKKFIDDDGSLDNNGSFIGETITLKRIISGSGSGSGKFYGLNFPASSQRVCPSDSVPSCGQLGASDYRDNISCSNKYQFQCGQPIAPAEDISAFTSDSGASQHFTRGPTNCLIHADDFGLDQGQDRFCASGGGCSTPTPATLPVVIRGDYNNPNSSLDNDRLLHSDSAVIVPLYDGSDLSCPPGGGTCTATSQVVGFLQVGITQACDPGSGCTSGGAGPQVEAVILNAVGCKPGLFGTGSRVAGNGVSPVPVRLIHQAPTP